MLDLLILNTCQVILMPKVASTSMRKLSRIIPGIRVLDQGDPYPPLPTLAFIRDPLERFWSAAANTGNINIYQQEISYQTFVDMTFNTGNDHWALQASLLPSIPDLTLYRYEDLEKVWKDYKLPELSKENVALTRTRGFKQTIDKAYRYRELLERYRPDIILREGIKPWK